ncbi:protein of unknown function UPF0079 [Chloroherpeton thalassium ATCC 35110]|uniref:tRNA threonylcarbamoyladenosine biosynthesis protein TsaE n=1 Tax=Chloroherpeton thalassium (strain ATCC 35110 / GB-78) TaxID=517418 RepID=B3QSE6_CHLT3|nr:tRNA (adenosine(37)-N6)-threonylcarbamoyltransferase complex ATPase subunit type 1 TsaE [Chloroherpeton thalassium]ACF12537.1 protein of unknown function UPF0079 [Chloroherpeton thalassium ATCC 35110]
MKEFLSRSAEETRGRAREFAETLQRGDIVLLVGTLGAGKTEFVRGICDVFHCTASVSSPTFTLLNIYEGVSKGSAISLYHFDLYRIESETELPAIGFDEYLFGDGVSIVEWADRFPRFFPKQAITVQIEPCGENERRVVISGGKSRF